MKTIWPDQSGCLCARMSRGFNGQDAVGLLVVTEEQNEQILLRRERAAEPNQHGRKGKHAGLYARPAVCCREEDRKYFGGGISNTLDASYYKGTGMRGIREREFVAIENEKPQRKYIVRRLTPTECARLQGFPMVVEVNIEKMTNDELAMLCMAEGFIKVDPSTGKIYGNRWPGGLIKENYQELTGTIINGYKTHKLHLNGYAKPVRANRIVWMYVNGAIPDGLVVDHINCNKLDNRIENLQLLTPEQNSTKAKNDGLYPSGDDCKSSRSKESDRKTISYLYWHTDTTCKRLADMFGLSQSRIQQIIHEYEWTDGADGSDSAQYKLWGNGIALPCAEDVLRRIAEELRKDDEQRSD